MPDTLVRIGELATRAGVSNRTIDYYTGLGLLTPAERTAGGYRLYHPADVDRIHLIQRLEGQGIPLEEIAAALRARPADTAKTLAQLDGDLKNLQTAAESAPAEIQGLLNIIAARVHSLVSVALEIQPTLPLL
ncbi:MerR family transcriptional regulator [Nocardia cyriacigeorgica]|uniref:MerR family transcriptional regulator n=1 Tax=Nocardia cyriacigeorgica TaxID=135487 RepID=A0A5R8PIC1_9NOCA|nr:MerR family transcriptional regulator [Nocardia cyriacigeorgica]TLG15751.1 MerR family transcriptional regulator [Nocardia cyriacigeorgica]